MSLSLYSHFFVIQQDDIFSYKCKSECPLAMNELAIYGCLIVQEIKKISEPSKNKLLPKQNKKKYFSWFCEIFLQTFKCIHWWISRSYKESSGTYYVYDRKSWENIRNIREKIQHKKKKIFRTIILWSINFFLWLNDLPSADNECEDTRHWFKNIAIKLEVTDDLFATAY